VPFPTSAVRDLIGVARSLRRSLPPHERVRNVELRTIEVGLEKALVMGAEARPGSDRETAARALAERCARDLGACLGMGAGASPLAAAACAAVRGRR
jgi:hypothetical protein